MNRRFSVAIGVLVLFLLGVYLAASLQGGEGRLLLPLDDAYIHFQYAKQLALGHPFQYNLDGVATSGATSLLYPFMLAVGYALGFTGLSLALWAITLGAVALFGTLILTWRWLTMLDVPTAFRAIAVLLVACVSAWHFFSGMETGWVVFAAIATLTSLTEKRPSWLVASASLLTVLRPEGGLMAASAVVLFALFQWRTLTNRQKIGLLIPMALIGLQPVVNYLFTGSFVATGNQSKSILATVGADTGQLLLRVLANVGRMWGEWLLGRGEQGWYLPPLTGLVALVGVVLLLKRPTRALALVVLAWLLLISASVSTLDNAFWHFKRYQMPVMVMLAIVAFVGVAWAWRKVSVWRYGAMLASVFVLFSGLLIGARFVELFRLNVSYVYAQPYQMAEWLRNNTPPDAIVAVHDVGMMRYWGERNTLDMVGLTTPDAALYWRNGVGSVAELLLAKRPDYIASYGRGHGYGLGMLENTSLMRDPLASFTVPIDPSSNVALAADTQGIYQVDWETLRFPDWLSKATNYYTSPQWGTAQTLNVGNLQSEATFGYSWVGAPEIGYLTEVYDQLTIGDVGDFGVQEDESVLDGCRRIMGSETMTFPPIHDTYMRPMLVSRIHSTASGTLDVVVNGELIATRTLINAPGMWQEIATRIPDKEMQTPTTVTLIPHTQGDYCAARHTLFTAMNFGYEGTRTDVRIASFSDEAFNLAWVSSNLTPDFFVSTFMWSTLRETPGDTRMFVHIYDNLDQPPVAQWDGYPLDGLPTGNWLLGGLYDTIHIDTSHLEAGEYTVALGFYDVQTGQRMDVISDTLEVRDNRLILEKVIIGG